MKPILIVLAILAAGCRFDLTSPSPPTQTQTTNVSVTPPPTPPTPVPPTTTIPPGNGSPGTPLPLPVTGQSIASQYAAAYAGLLATSCQAAFGPSAWQYLDGLVAALRATDQRWGYVCKYGQCSDISADVIGYLGVGTPIRGAQGMHSVDVIANHCGTMPAASWNPLGYDATGTWAPSRF